MLGQTLVTHQTGPTGKVVRKVLVVESVDIAREVYVAILVDRASEAPVVVASTEGGVEIERVAEEHPEKIIREPVNPLLGLQPFQALKLGRQLDFRGDQLKAASKLLANLYNLFVSLDCSLVEINPLVVTKGGEVLALDAKFNFDDNALYRHKEVLEMRDLHEEDPREVEASKFRLNYIGLEGNIACLVNGAGLAMARFLSFRLPHASFRGYDPKFVQMHKNLVAAFRKSVRSSVQKLSNHPKRQGGVCNENERN
jgi:succinyl-CoA synthetase beta subunit